MCWNAAWQVYRVTLVNIMSYYITSWQKQANVCHFISLLQLSLISFMAVLHLSFIVVSHLSFTVLAFLSIIMLPHHRPNTGWSHTSLQLHLFIQLSLCQIYARSCFSTSKSEKDWALLAQFLSVYVAEEMSDSLGDGAMNTKPSTLDYDCLLKFLALGKSTSLN